MITKMDIVSMMMHPKKIFIPTDNPIASDFGHCRNVIVGRKRSNPQNSSKYAAWTSGDASYNKFLNVYNFINDISMNMDDHVSTFKIAKRSGGFRTIIAPDEILKTIQKNLITNVFGMYKASSACHGFMRRRNIATNANPHVGARSMCHMDIKSFFDSIRPDHVEDILHGGYWMCSKCTRSADCLGGKCTPSIYKTMNNEYDEPCYLVQMFSGLSHDDVMLSYNSSQRSLFGNLNNDNPARMHPDSDSVIKLITRLTTYKGCAPQGFPTSPYIGNIVLKRFDKLVLSEFHESGITYTRYADDMAFSSKEEDTRYLYKAVNSLIPSMLNRFGFNVNQDKTYYVSNNRRMSICGVVVNEKLNIPRSKRKNIRAGLYNELHGKNQFNNYEHLKGYVSFIHMVNTGSAEPLKGVIDKIDAKKSSELIGAN